MTTRASQRPLKRRRFTPCRVINDDYFSRLPDEIISCHILPKLNAREAASTTILSRRWRNLWSIDHDIPSSLVFRYSPESKLYTCEYLVQARSMITDAINRILKTHYTKPTLDELTICFNFDSSSLDDIYTWLEIAFEKGVKRLELDLSNPLYDKYCQYHINYAFPSIEKLSSLHMQAGINNLRELYLKYVKVSSQVVEFLLYNCPSLERLSVLRHGLESYVIFICKQKTTKLKWLELDGYGLMISASNLVSLQYSNASRFESLFIGRAPNLSEVSIGDKYCTSFFESDVKEFPVTQLKTFKLDVPYLTPNINIKCRVPFPKFANLEQLEVKMMVTEDTDFYSWLIVLIQAAPLLQRFSINPTFTHAIRMIGNPPRKVASEVEKAFKQMNRLQCLRSIELRGHGHHCRSCLLELCRHLMHISDALEEFVIIDHPNPRFGPQGMDCLIKFVPPGVDLVHL